MTDEHGPRFCNCGNPPGPHVFHERQAKQPLRWSCGEVVQPGETYKEHVKGCTAGKEPDAADRSDVR